MSDSSTGLEVEGDLPETSAPVTDVKTDSSPSGGEDLISSVTEALKPSDKEASPVSGEGSADLAAPPASAEEPLGELTDQELARYGPKTQRRIRQLLDARLELNTEVEGLRPKAKSFEQIDEYIRTNRLSNEDFAVLLELGALSRNDPFKAYERFAAITVELAKVTGHQLPPELQERVNLGYLTEQDARSIVQNQQRANLAEQRAKEQAAQTTESQNRAAVQAHVQTCRQTANTWEAQRKSTDPDWTEKQDKIGQLIELEVYRNGYPRTQEEVVKMLEGFLKQVNTDMSRFKTPLREINPVTSSASPRAGKAEPQTLMDFVNAALDR